MKKVFIVAVLVALSGCEAYIKSGVRPVHEHQESQRTYDRPIGCALWNFAGCKDTAEMPK